MLVGGDSERQRGKTACCKHLSILYTQIARKPPSPPLISELNISPKFFDPISEDAHGSFLTHLFITKQLPAVRRWTGNGDAACSDMVPARSGVSTPLGETSIHQMITHARVHCSCQENKVEEDVAMETEKEDFD